MKQKHVLVIDDEPAMRHMLRLVLEKERYIVTEAGGGEEALAILSREDFAAILCDIRMPGMDGLGFLRQLASCGHGETVIMMSAYGSIDSAIACMKEGAYDYISKPFKPDEVVLTLRKAEERQRLRLENDRLRRELKGREQTSEIVGHSPAIARLLTLIERVAENRSPVLITGETGTGKELVARALHAGSGRRNEPFVAINCSAISAGLLESELFGHVKGAFTGADRERAGLFAAANGGTLFLDEIGELPLELQPKLLRVLQEGEIRRVGDNRPNKVDVRVLAATARNLKDEVGLGHFRDDLYYRLAVIEIVVPPLRERAEDIPVLAEYFLQRIARREERPQPQLREAAKSALVEYCWPGNIRELENFMEKTMIFCRGAHIERDDLAWDIRRCESPGEEASSLKSAMVHLEREYIVRALKASGGNRTQAARQLEISLRGLLYKIKTYKLEGF